MQPTVVGVGVGHAGVQLADTLRADGFTGRIVLVDSQPHAPYQRPPLSKEFLTGSDATPLPLRALTFFSSRDVDLRLGVTAMSLDPKNRVLHVSDGQPITYDHLVLASGAAARTLDVPGASLSGIVTLRTRDDAMRLRLELAAATRIIVVGAGFIGLELAAVAIALGKQVHVIDPMPRALSRTVSAEVASHLVHRLREQGVVFSFNTEVVGFEGDHRVRTTMTSAGTVPTDLAVVGIGIAPRSELARDACLKVDGGVIVNASLQSSAPRVYAVGDLAVTPVRGRAMRVECVQNATDQGKYVAQRIAGTVDNDYAQVPRFWSHQGPVRLQVAGLVTAGCNTETIGDVETGAFSVRHVLDGELVAVESINRAKDHLTARRELQPRYATG